eukprot:gb/GEZN01000089.1/.p1 GENE.gb/GEZN01000089.1/~~gb/GEZN01000089.1/.p1  ORF type:complete len:2202 (-),score=366.59 gb/GEZN01000089.1/:786-7310(-)
MPPHFSVVLGTRYAFTALGFLFAFFGFYFQRTFCASIGFMMGWMFIFGILGMDTELTRQGFPELMAMTGAIVGSVMALLVPGVTLSFATGIVLTDMLSVLTSGSRDPEQIERILSHPYYHDRVDNVPMVSSQAPLYSALLQIPVTLLCMGFVLYYPKTAVNIGTAMVGAFISVVALDQFTSKSFTTLCFFDTPLSTAMGVNNALLICDRMCVIVTAAWFFLTLMGTISQFLFQYTPEPRRRRGERSPSLSYGGTGTTAEEDTAQGKANLPTKKATKKYPTPDESEGFNYFSGEDMPESMKVFAARVDHVVSSHVIQFGFQQDNARCQAEHVVFLLSNYYTEGKLPQELHRKIFSNYKAWCDHLSVNPQLQHGSASQKQDDPIISDLALWFLVWGEGSNLRHCPELLCFLFHSLSQEALVATAPVLTREPNAFLEHVVKPIYTNIKNLQSKGEIPVNYDDINEFFWFPECLQYYYGHPNYAPTLLPGHSGHSSKEPASAKLAALVPPSLEMCLPKVLEKTPKSFLEKRTWLMALRAFHRVFTVLIVMLHLFICIAYIQEKSLLVADVFANQLFSSVCITLAVISLWKELLEVWACYGMKSPSKFGFFVRLILKAAALIMLSFYYYNAWESSRYVATYFDPNRNDVTDAWKVYFLLASLYAIPWLCRVVCAFKPGISTWARNSKGLVNKLLHFWWPCCYTFVGKDMHSSSATTYKYQIYWISMMLWKAFVSYFYQIAPLMYPTLRFLSDSRRPKVLDWLAVSILWLPFVVVFFFDFMIWNSLWQCIAGIQVGMVERVGEVQGFPMLAKLFTSAPGRFQKFLMGEDSDALDASNPSSRRNSLFKSPFAQQEAQAVAEAASTSFQSSEPAGTLVTSAKLEEEKATRAAGRPVKYLSNKWKNFAIAWNEVIGDLRRDDMISNKESHTLIFRFNEETTKEFYLPLIVTADLVEGAMDRCAKTAKEFENQGEREQQLIERELVGFFNQHRLAREACEEVWELTSWLLSTILGENHWKEFKQILAFIKETAVSKGFLKSLNLDLVQGPLKEGVLGVSRSLRIASVHFRKMVEDKRQGIVSVRKDDDQGSASDDDVFAGEAAASAEEGEAESGDEGDHLLTIPKQGQGDLRRAQDIRKTKKMLSMTRNVSSGTLFLLDRMKNRRRDRDPNANPYITLSVDLLRDQVRKLLELLPKFTKNNKDVVAPMHTILKQQKGFFKDDKYTEQQLLAFFSAGRSLETIETLHAYLTVQTESEVRLKEAKERLLFFFNSLYMNLPVPPTVKKMKSWSIMTPFYSEDILYSFADLEKVTEDGFSTFVYLQTIYPQEWANFLERNGLSASDSSVLKIDKSHEARLWATRRGQTLYRTVNGMMRYQKALSLLAGLENPREQDDEARALEMTVQQKFQYVVSCQVYGKQRKELDPKAKDIAHLLAVYPHLRVAYVDNKKETVTDDQGVETQVENFYSVLVKSGPGPGSEEERVQEVFRVLLPGNPILGEGKPENQNHAIIFTRGEYIQAIDMNQDNTLDDALKMRNLLEEFDGKSGEQDIKKRPLTIAGFREKIFTGSLSSVANYMALQEMCFVTLGQRVLDKPLRMRFHYGHPDVFDKLFFIPRGGVSKAGKGIHLSEDIFAGYNNTLRGGRVCFREYLQVGKGRDVGLRQLYLFEAKLSQGNCMQSLSRDVYRLAQGLDIFKVFTLFYGGVGFYISNVLTVWAVYLFLYSRVVICCLGLEKYTPFSDHTTVSFWFGAAGFLLTAPLWGALGIDKGFLVATKEVLSMLLSGGPLYFLFHMGTKAHYFNTTMFFGQPSYRATGRGFVTTHERFGENYRAFASSHFYKASELLMLLVIFCSLDHHRVPLLESTWAIWAIVFSWFCSPLWFNPMSFDWDKTQDDIADFVGWIDRQRGDDGRCWKTWWWNETSPFRKLDFEHKVVSSIYALRFTLLGFVLIIYKQIRVVEFSQGIGLAWSIWFLYMVINGEFGPAGSMERSTRAFTMMLAFAFPLAIIVLASSFSQIMLVVVVLSLLHHTFCHWMLVWLPFFNGHVARYNHLCDQLIGALLLGFTSVLALLIVPGMIQTRLMFYGAFNRGILIDALLQTNKKREDVPGVAKGAQRKSPSGSPKHSARKRNVKPTESKAEEGKDGALPIPPTMSVGEYQSSLSGDDSPQISRTDKNQKKKSKKSKKSQA